MNSNIEQQNFPNPEADLVIFASDPSATVVRPDRYVSGVDVNFTAPAKWWNWLWQHITAWLAASKNDRVSMFTEMENVLEAASILPIAAEEHQVSAGVSIIAYDEAKTYDSEEITEIIGGVSVTHKKNQPYVVGHTLYIPDTELL